MADPYRRVAVVAQGVAGIRVQKNIERAVIQREPGDEFGELRRREGELIRPHRMRPDRAFVKAAQLQFAVPVRFDLLAKGPRCVAAA